MAGSFISGGTDGRRVGKHNLRRNNSGFTLVELIVVIVLIAVMAALTVGGILSWRDWADFNRENEYAETLFVAAQNQLNDYSADGRLEAMQKALKPDFSKAGGSTEDDNADVMSRLRSVSGNRVEFGVGKNWKVYDGDTLNEHFVESGYTRDEINNIWKNSGAEEKYQDRIISLRANKGDYSGYLSGTYSKNTEQYWVYELLSSYIYDQSILNDAAICIELTPADGQVFSVFYSDKNKSYTYAKSEVEDNNSDVYDITYSSDEAENKRSEEKRRSRKVGYYDVEALYKATTTASRKSPVIDHVEVHNEETLYLTYEITKEPQAVNQLTYKVSLLDADKGNKPELVIEIDGTKIKGRNIGLDGDLLPLSGSLEKYTVPCKVTRYDLACETGSTEVRRASESSSASVSSGVVMDSVPVIVWSEGTDSAGNYITTGSTTVPRIHVLLDMADLNATQDKYADYSKGIRDFYKDKRFGSSGDNSLSQDANIEDNSFTGTQSFFRFGLAPDDVFAKVEGSSTSKYKSPAPANNIDAWGRNLENTGFAEGSEAAEGEEGKKRITYSVTKSRHLYNMRYIEALDYESQDIVLITAGPAAQLGYAPVAGVDYTIVRDSDNNGDIAWDKSIEKQLADKADQPLRAVSDNSIYPACERLRVNDTIFGGGNTISGLKVSNEKVTEENKYTAFNPTGFINRNYGTVRDLTLDRTEVSGGDFTGGFFGVNACEATNLTVSSNCVVEGRKYVGGMAGVVLPSGNHCRESEITNAKTGEKQTLSNNEIMSGLTNRAEITGSQAVGGIAGAVRNDFAFIKELYGGTAEGEMTGEELKAEFPGLFDNDEKYAAAASRNDKTSFLISECSNFGAVKCIPSEDGTIGSRELAYIGGITGYVYDGYSDDNDNPHLIVDSCNGAPMYDEDYLFNNKTGVFRSVSGFTVTDKGDYAGGIAGYNYGGQISECYSEAEENGKSYIFGKNYVGGLVGLNRGYITGNEEAEGINSGFIGDSSSGENKYINNNIVAGDKYVGGIVGCNADLAYSDDSSTEGTESGEETSEIDNDPETIISKAYSSDEKKTEIIPIKEINLRNKISGFINKAQVYSRVEYGGGITGYNTGYLFRNNNIYDTPDAGVLFMDREDDYTGSYIGGISGYNNGIIGNTERVVSSNGVSSTVAGSDNQSENPAIKCSYYIRGNSFLGGLVGYNDSDSIIENYVVENGKIQGISHNNNRSCFVGGIAGFNSSARLLDPELINDNNIRDDYNAKYSSEYVISSGKSIVNGDYFVGGGIGGNILNRKEIEAGVTNISGSYDPGSTVTGREFVGGFIGYNLIINNTKEQLSSIDNGGKDLYPSGLVAEYLVASLSKKQGGVTDTRELLKANKELIDNLADEKNIKGLKFTEDKEEDYLRLFIREQKSSTSLPTYPAVKGKLYVGGVVGYNDDNAILWIQDVQNTVKVTAEEYIYYEKERDLSTEINGIPVKVDGRKDYAGVTHNKDDFNRYSYGGGIIGRVANKTRLIACSNADKDLVKVAGTYHGGLCEVNAGMLIRCEVSDLAFGTYDYVGGLCGLNKGTITECSIDTVTVAGGNVVGGLSAENYGTLSNNCIKNASIRAGSTEDGVAGTYTGINGASGIVTLSGNSVQGQNLSISEYVSGSNSDADYNVNVFSSGRFAGGIVGVNKGFIRNAKTGLIEDYSTAAASTYIKISGEVKGNSVVGGLVGLNSIDTEGLTEEQALNYMIKGFNNQTKVTAGNIKSEPDDKEGTAGGIAGKTEGYSYIRFCANSGEVSSPGNGNAGGITAENNGVIDRCIDTVNVNASNGMSGGIAAINGAEGTISNVRVEGSSGVGQSLLFTGKISCGAITAENQGRISGIRIRYVNIENIKAENGNDASNSYIGAVTGRNIFPAGYSWDTEEVRKKHGYIDLTGMSDSEDSETSVVNKIQNCTIGVRSSNTEAGGIAGENKGTIAGSESSYAYVNPVIELKDTDRASMGGVAGSNYRDIKYISVHAVITGGKGNSNIGYGGITGINSGNVSYCSFDGKIKAAGDSSNIASVGGIAGINRNGAEVSHCTVGADNRSSAGSSDITEILSDTSGTFAYLGGIAGSNYGRITDIDLNGQEHKETVNIRGYDGAQGGIAGLNGTGGSITGYEDNGTEHGITTSDKMLVAMLGNNSGNGTGGIIGINNTGSEMSYVRNYANVSSGSTAGGLIGLSGSNGFNLRECINRGDIESVNGDAGGLIGLATTGSDSYITSSANHGHVHVPMGESGEEENIRTYREGDIEYTFKVTSDLSTWTTGYNAEITIKNGSTRIDNWAVVTDIPGNITVYDARIYQKEPYYVIKTASYNAEDMDLEPNEEIQIHFQGQEGFIDYPTFFHVISNSVERDRSDYSVTFEPYNGERLIRITNNTDAVIEDWKLFFTFNKEIFHVYPQRYEKISEEENRYMIRGNSDSGTNYIRPGTSVEIHVQYIDPTPEDTLSYYTLYSYETQEVTPGSTFIPDIVNTNNGAGGFIGAYAQIGDSRHVYLYDCVNTGIVEREGVDSENKKVARDVGNFVGRGNTDQKAYWHFDTCRNYNPIEGATEGFTGKSVGMIVGRFNKCLDDSALVTDSKDYSPFVSAMEDENKVDMTSCYYFGEDEDETTEDSHGTYFTFSVAEGNINYGNKSYDELKSPAVFLKRPSKDSGFSYKGNQASYEFDIVNEANSSGMSSFNVYLWNGRNKISDIRYGYTVTTKFVYEDKSVDTVWNQYIAASSELKESELKVNVPNQQKKVIRVVITITWNNAYGNDEDITSETQEGNKTIYLRGFTWTPKGLGEEAKCVYLDKWKDTSFEITGIQTDSPEAYFQTDKGDHVLSKTYPSGVLGINWLDNETFYLKKSKNGTAKINFNIVYGNNEKDTRIQKFGFYPRATNSDCTYYYRIKYYDELGNSDCHPSNGSFYDITIKKGQTKEDIYRENKDKIFSTVQYGNNRLSGRAVRVELEFGKIIQEGVGNIDRVVLSGFEFMPRFENNIPYIIAPVSASEDTGSDKSMSLSVDYSKSTTAPYVYYKKDRDHGFDMDANDPINTKYMTDSSDYVTSKNAGQNSRINVYEDIDPKFVNVFLPNQKGYQDKLSTPYIEALTMNSAITVDWDEVENAYEYEVSYKVENNETGEVVESHDAIKVGSEITSYSIINKDSWNDDASCSIEYKVKAVNAFSYAEEGSHEYDSDSATVNAIISRKTLPKPQVHLELTPDNKMAVVLDNREVSVENGGYKKSDGSYVDCKVEVAYDAENTEPYVYTVSVSENAVSNERYEIKINEKDGQDPLGYKPQLTAKARPTISDNTVSENDIYLESEPAENSGMLADNYTLVNGDPDISEQDKGSTYFNYSGSDRLLGFRGSDYRTAEYVMQYSDTETREAVMMEDITAYDKKLGIDVTIAKEETITTGQGDQVKMINNLPAEWFGEDAPESLLVRSYLGKSQNEVVHYGHTVSENIVLDKDTPEENRAVLAGIKDPYYLGSVEEAVNEEHSVWDETANNGEGGLKPGYVLIRKVSGEESTEEESQKITYTLYYNATLELADKNAGDGQEYSKYDVTYKRYSTKIKDTMIEEQQEDTDPEEVKAVKTAKVRTTAPESNDKFNDEKADYQEAYGINNGNDYSPSRAYQDMRPAPIMDGKIRWSEDADGNETYTVRWDPYYRNNEVWNNGWDPVEDKDLIDGYKWYQTDNNLIAGDEDRYVAPTWTAFADKTGYYDEATGDGVRKDIMNAYLMTYAGTTGEDEAEGAAKSGYTVEVIGYDDADPDNKKVLHSLTGTDNIRLTEVYDYYTKQNYEYKVSDDEVREVPKYSKWVYEATFTKDTEWNYDRYEIRIVNNGSTKCLVSSLGNDIGNIVYEEPVKALDGSYAYFGLPRYTEFLLDSLKPFEPTYNIGADHRAEEENGNNLEYTVEWSWSGFDNDQNSDLGGFLISVKQNAEDTSEGKVGDHYFYIEEIGDTEAIGSAIDLDLYSLDPESVVTELTADKSGYMTDGNRRSVNIDLGDFYDGAKVDIAVSAVPRTGAVNYCDGEPGVLTGYALGSARKAPDPDSIQVDGLPDRIPEYDDVIRVSSEAVTTDLSLPVSEDDGYSTVSRDVWENGLWIKYDGLEGIDFADDDPANIYAAIAVYENAPDNMELPGKYTDENRMSAVADSAEVWNKDAVKTLYTKDEPLDMGSAADSDYVRVILSDDDDEYGIKYAGKWLKVALKARSEKGYTSRWSDQDAGGVSVNYRWIHLPYIRGISNESNIMDPEGSTYNDYRISSGAGDLLTDGSVSGENNGELLHDAEQLIPDSSVSKPEIRSTPTPTPALVPEPTATPTPVPTPLPEDADVPSSGTGTETENDEDKDKGSSGNGGSGGQESGSDPGTTDNNAGAQPEGNGGS